MALFMSSHASAEDYSVKGACKYYEDQIAFYYQAIARSTKKQEEAFDNNDASKIPKSFAQTLKEKGLKDGTYQSLKGKQIPKALDVSTSRFYLAKKVINEYVFHNKKNENYKIEIEKIIQ